MQLIDEGFSGWWKKWSVQVLGVIGAVNAAWLASPEFQQMLGTEGIAIANGILAALGFVARFLKQTNGSTV